MTNCPCYRTYEILISMPFFTPTLILFFYYSEDNCPCYIEFLKILVIGFLKSARCWNLASSFFFVLNCTRYSICKITLGQNAVISTYGSAYRKDIQDLVQTRLQPKPLLLNSLSLLSIFISTFSLSPCLSPVLHFSLSPPLFFSGLPSSCWSCCCRWIRRFLATPIVYQRRPLPLKLGEFLEFLIKKYYNCFILYISFWNNWCNFLYI